jgi:hypothetical protein
MNNRKLTIIFISILLVLSCKTKKYDAETFSSAFVSNSCNDLTVVLREANYLLKRSDKILPNRADSFFNSTISFTDLFVNDTTVSAQVFYNNTPVDNFTKRLNGKFSILVIKNITGVYDVTVQMDSFFIGNRRIELNAKGIYNKWNNEYFYNSFSLKTIYDNQINGTLNGSTKFVQTDGSGFNSYNNHNFIIMPSGDASTYFGSVKFGSKNDLSTSYACGKIFTGIIEVQKQDFEPRIINYGLITCDDFYKIVIEGSDYEYKLR